MTNNNGERMMIAQNIHNDRSSVFIYMRYIKRIYRLDHIDDIFQH